MAVKEVGARMGAMMGSKGGRVQLFGYGVYEGDFKIPMDSEEVGAPVGFTADMVRDAIRDGHLTEEEAPSNPRIRLDDGKVVWGCECWWASEEKVKQICAAADSVEVVDIDAIREEIRREEG